VHTYELFVLLLAATVRVSVPLILAALAGLFSERSGVVDVGLEGKMLAAAFSAGAVASIADDAWLGLLAGIGVSTAFGALHGIACITYRGNQVVAGVAINIIASGLTIVLGRAWFQEGGQTPQLTSEGRFAPIEFPGSDAIREIPILGPLYSDLLGNHNVLVYIAFAVVPITWWVLYRTRFGLRLRAVGENPAAVDTAGISVPARRFQAVIIAGALCGVAGTYMSCAQTSGFLPNMTAGKGFIALAALVFGKWRPIPTMLACLLFGLLDALADRLQGVPLPGIGEIPVQFIQALPYVLTVILLAGLIGKSIPPKADGLPYIKER
jgi:simple sugar transport system permease protein